MSLAPRILVGASIPRSGHHFLARILGHYFGPALHYCEFYGPPACCRQIPCTKRGGFDIVFQKNHDFDLALDPALPDVTYVVQYRHPVPEAASDWDLAKVETLGGFAHGYLVTRERFAWWLAEKAVYYRRFHAKWVARPPARSVVLDYDALRADPVRQAGDVARAAAGTLDTERLAAAVATASRVRDRSGTVYVPRRVDAAAFAHPDLVAAFEEHVLRHGPGYGFAPMLGGGYEGSELQGLILALDPAEPVPAGAGSRQAAIQALAGAHPEIRLREARRHLKAGSPAEAVEVLTQVLRAFPQFRPAWPLLLRGWREAGLQPDPDLLSAEAVFGLAGQPALLQAIAATWLSAGRPVQAAAALQILTGFHPDAARPHTLLALALERLGQYAAAIRAGEAAIARDPAEDQAAALVTRLRAHGW